MTQFENLYQFRSDVTSKKVNRSEAKRNQCLHVITNVSYKHVLIFDYYCDNLKLRCNMFDIEIIFRLIFAKNYQ